MDALLQLDHHAPRRLGRRPVEDHVEQVVPRLIGEVEALALGGRDVVIQVPVLDDGREILSLLVQLSCESGAADAWRGLDERQHRLSASTEKGLVHKRV
jgi:hypothetical protein